MSELSENNINRLFNVDDFKQGNRFHFLYRHQPDFHFMFLGKGGGGGGGRGGVGRW